MTMHGGISYAHEVEGLAGIFLPTLECCLYNIFPNKNILLHHLYGCYLTFLRSRQFTQPCQDQLRGPSDSSAWLWRQDSCALFVVYRSLLPSGIGSHLRFISTIPYPILLALTPIQATRQINRQKGRSKRSSRSSAFLRLRFAPLRTGATFKTSALRGRSKCST
jgi:hypothetical protein